jgi:hypothetical protein
MKEIKLSHIHILGWNKRTGEIICACKEFYFFDKLDNKKTIVFYGTEDEIKTAERWPSFLTTEYGQKLIRRFASSPAEESWEIFCCQSG